MTHSFPTRRSSDLFAHERGGATGPAACPQDRRTGSRPYPPTDHIRRTGRGCLAAARESAARTIRRVAPDLARGDPRSEEHTSELQSLMRISYAVFCLKKKKHTITTPQHEPS